MSRSVSFLRARWRLVLLAAFLFMCVLFGGSSFPDNPSLLAVRPLAVIYLIVSLALPGLRDWAGLRQPLILLIAFAGTIALQLVPLPPLVWTALPGHARFIEVADALGVAQPWRPVSVAPDMTLNSLIALVVPLSVLIGAATITLEDRIKLLPVLLIAMICSALLGVAQWAGSTASTFYLYSQTSFDLPVGFFANRNHQALFLAMAFPLLRAWTVLPSRIVPRHTTRSGISLALSLLVLPVLLASGSRTGLILGGLAVGSTLLIAPPAWRVPDFKFAFRRRETLIYGVAVATVFAVVGSAIFYGRALSITRLGQFDEIGADLRLRFLPIIVHITRDFFPFGSGYGTFDAMFRLYEPVWALQPVYFNRAHDDLLELAMTGGAPALLVLAAFVVFGANRIRAILTLGWRSPSTVVAKTGAALVALPFFASLTDYPLRTPAIDMVLTLAVIWLSTPFSTPVDAVQYQTPNHPNSTVGRERGRLM